MRLTIMGASGHGKVVADIARLVGYNEISFLDDDPTIAECGGYPIVGKTSEAPQVAGDLFVAIGNASVRRILMERFAARTFPVLVHPAATVARDVSAGPGTVVMAGAVINPGTTIGRGCIVNTCASVDHDCDVGDYVHISVGAHLCGTVAVGAGTWVGAGSTVINNIGIRGNSIIGAGAVVIRDIEEEGTYIGVPAKMMNKMLFRGVTPP